MSVRGQAVDRRRRGQRRRVISGLAGIQRPASEEGGDDSRIRDLQRLSDSEVDIGERALELAVEPASI